MKKILVNILCAFIPSKFLRDRLRVLFSDNQILVIDKGKERRLRLFEFKKLKISFEGEYRNNNIVKIHKNVQIEGEMLLGHNNEIYISNYVAGKVNIYSCHNNKIIISDKVSFNKVAISAFKYAELIIGKDCQFSHNISIFVSDYHPIFDKKIEKLLQVKSKLLIGKHCWIGYGCIITKNAFIPDNTIVGAGSVVTNKFEKEYTAIAGNPAKIIKEGVMWER